MKYHDAEPISREEAVRRIGGTDVDAACHALVGLAFHEEDWRYVQTLCLTILAGTSHELRALAVTCLGHVARIHGVLDLEIVEPVLRKAHGEPELTGLVEDVFDNIQIFVKKSKAGARRK